MKSKFLKMEGVQIINKEHLKTITGGGAFYFCATCGQWFPETMSCPSTITHCKIK